MAVLHEKQVATADVLLEAGRYSALTTVSVGIKSAFVGWAARQQE